VNRALHAAITHEQQHLLRDVDLDAGRARPRGRPTRARESRPGARPDDSVAQQIAPALERSYRMPRLLAERTVDPAGREIAQAHERLLKGTHLCTA
jgi:hypothetical protein